MGWVEGGVPIIIEVGKGLIIINVVYYTEETIFFTHSIAQTENLYIFLYKMSQMIVDIWSVSPWLLDFYANIHVLMYVCRCLFYCCRFSKVCFRA